MNKLINFIEIFPDVFISCICLQSGETCRVQILDCGISITNGNDEVYGDVIFEADYESLTFLALALERNQHQDLTPNEMISPPLKIITNALLECSSLNEITQTFRFWVNQYKILMMS